MNRLQNQMRILIVASSYPPFDKGGGGKVAQTLVRKLAERGHNVTIMVGYHERKWREDVENDRIKIIWVPLMTIFPTRYPQIQDSLPPTLRSIIRLRKLNYSKFDVIHFLDYGHLMIDYVNLITSSSKKVMTIYAFPAYVKNEGKANPLLKLVYKLYDRTLGAHTLRSVKAVTAISKFVLDDCIKHKISQSKLHLVTPGIDLDEFRPVDYQQLEETFNISKSDFVILSIARIVWYKGFEYAIEAIAKVSCTIDKQIKYLILGSVEDEKYYSTLTTKIKELKLEHKVIFGGFVKDELKLQALSRADIFLAPSLHEGFGMVVTEAMALKKPIIASNTEGFLTILEHMNTGILVKADDPIEIAKGLTKLLKEHDLRITLANNAYREVQKFSWNALIDRYEGIYMETAGIETI